MNIPIIHSPHLLQFGAHPSMQVVLRSDSDLLCQPDHGWVGEEGALRVLLQVTRQIRRLNISHNQMGAAGVEALLKGLSTLRMRYSSQEGGGLGAGQGGGRGIWGMKEINLGCNALNDKAFDAVMAYAKKDVCLQKLLLQANEITMQRGAESIVNSLNGSNIRTLSLTNNPNLQASSVIYLFEQLNAKHLTELHLSTCNLEAEIAPAIAAFLRSPRSRNLESLELNGNRLGLVGVREIVDAVENDNFTIKHLGLFANDPVRRTRLNEDESEEQAAMEAEDERTEEEKHNEEAGIHYQVHDRLPPLLERNRTLTRRVRRAALRCLPVATIVLNARPRPVTESTARQIIEDVASSYTPRTDGLNRTFRPFPMLEFPEEIVHLILRHCSHDPWALTDSQFAQIRRVAMDRNALKAVARVVKVRRETCVWGEEEAAERAVRDEWLQRQRWDKWELERRPLSDQVVHPTTSLLA